MNDARRIPFDAVVVDTHADTIDRALDKGEDLTVRTTRGHIDLPRMAEGLLARGYSETDVRKVLGENVLRILG